MEINFDMGRPYNCDVLWGRTYNTNQPVNYRKHGWGYWGKDDLGQEEVTEFQPMTFFNSYTELNVDIPYGDLSPDHSEALRMLEMHNASDELHMHGYYWTSQNIVFPQDIAHPYMEGTGSWYSYGGEQPRYNRTVVVGRPSIVELHANFKRKGTSGSYVLYKFVYYTGALSLASFFKDCKIYSPMNLYDFEPWMLLDPPLVGEDPFMPGYCRDFKWMNDLTEMYANEGCWLCNQLIDIPPFIETTRLMFNDTGKMSNQSEFGIKFNTDVIMMAKGQGPIWLNASGMFSRTNIDESNYMHITQNIHNLPRRIHNASFMFRRSNFHTNFNFDHRTIQNTANMFESSTLNSYVNFFGGVYTGDTTNFDDYISEHSENYTQINDASGMFWDCTDFNVDHFVYPNNGINNASCMFGFCTIFNGYIIPENLSASHGPSTNIRTLAWMNPLGTYGDDETMAYTNTVYIPSAVTFGERTFKTNNACMMFHECAALNKNIHIGYNTCDYAESMFRNCYDMPFNIYVGENSCSIANYMFSCNGTIGNGDTFIMFDANSLKENSERLFSKITGINVNTLTFGPNVGNNGYAMVERGWWSISTMEINHLYICDGAFPNGLGGAFSTSEYGAVNYNIGEIIVGSHVANVNIRSACTTFSAPNLQCNKLYIGSDSFLNADSMFSGCNIVTFADGVHISSGSCIHADGIFRHCSNIDFGGSNVVLAFMGSDDYDERRVLDNAFFDCNMGGRHIYVNNAASASNMFRDARHIGDVNVDSVYNCYAMFTDAQFEFGSTAYVTRDDGAIDGMIVEGMFRNTTGLKTVYLMNNDIRAGSVIYNSDVNKLYVADGISYYAGMRQVICNTDDISVYAASGDEAEEIWRYVDFDKPEGGGTIDFDMYYGYWVGYDEHGQEIWNIPDNYNSHGYDVGDIHYSTPNGEGVIIDTKTHYYSTSYPNVHIYGSWQV